MSYKEHVIELSWFIKLDYLARYSVDKNKSIRSIKERSWSSHRTLLLSVNYSRVSLKDSCGDSDA